jgi:DNA-binding HxlR family transcriptional regulator
MHGEPSEFEMIAGTRAVLELLDGKWTIEVLYLLAGGRRRYSEIYYEVGEVSKKVLTRRLRKLEQSGLVERTVYPEVPPRVEYSLTPLGWSITSPLMAMYEWASDNLASGRERLRLVQPLAA